MTTGPLLEVDGLSKRFPVRHNLLGVPTSWLSALDEVSFWLSPGETLGVVGESGSGKTTLARLLLRLVQPTAGRMTFDGTDVTRARGHDSLRLRQRMQIIFQDPFSSLDGRLRLGDIINEALYHSGLGRRQRKERISQLMEQVGLSPRMLSNYPHQLSGGQRQRIGIARALAANPDLLIADEPVSALDGSVQGQILNLLRSLQRQHGLSMIFITHDLSVARHMSDRVAVMHLGKIVETAPTATLFQSPAHPYTQALLSAIPTYGRGRRTRIVLRGDIPSPIDPPQACRFASRCFRRIDICTQREPLLSPELGADHYVACFNWSLPEDGHAQQRHAS
jgi:oligopeptide/dipeptide ABC transporter ATP-binding protein